jgi:hypothetical protein
MLQAHHCLGTAALPPCTVQLAETTAPWPSGWRGYVLHPHLRGDLLGGRKRFRRSWTPVPEILDTRSGDPGHPLRTSWTPVPTGVRNCPAWTGMGVQYAPDSVRYGPPKSWSATSGLGVGRLRKYAVIGRSQQARAYRVTPRTTSTRVARRLARPFQPQKPRVRPVSISP